MYTHKEAEMTHSDLYVQSCHLLVPRFVGPS